MRSAEFEWYLRRCCEDELVERRDLSVPTRAQALTAIGVLDEQVADAVLNGYATARSLRGNPHHSDFGRALPASPLGELTFRRCAATIAQRWGSATVRSLVTSDVETSISIEVNVTDDRVDHPFTDRLLRHRSIAVRDDRGRVHHPDFNGGGGETELSGHLIIAPALRRETAWITLLDHRIELIPASDDVTVEIVEVPETLSTSQRAARYLVRCLEMGTASHYDEDSVQVIFQTYVECGVLTAGSPAVVESPAVADLFAGGHSPSTAPPWSGFVLGHSGRRGLLNRGGRGPIGSRLIGVNTPTFDGIRVALTTLTSSRKEFRLGFRAGGPGIAKGPRNALPFAIAADDDIGNHYVGEQGDWQGGSDGMSGDIHFYTPLSPRAAVLSLRLSMIKSDAVVRIPLIWDGPS